MPQIIRSRRWIGTTSFWSLLGIAAVLAVVAGFLVAQPDVKYGPKPLLIDDMADGLPSIATSAFRLDAGWNELDPGPLGRRDGAAVVWTGSTLVVVGGDTGEPASALEAATYDPASRKWKRVERAPIASGPTDAVWNGREVIVITRGDSGRAQAAALSLPEGRWKRLPDPPISVANADAKTPSLVWAGDRALLTDSLHEWVPGSAAWMPLPTPPTAVAGAAAWTGNELVFVSPSHPVLRYHPESGVWVQSPGFDAPQTAGVEAAAWTGAEIVVVDSSGVAGSFSPVGISPFELSGQWKRLDDLPAIERATGCGAPQVLPVEGGAVYVVLCGRIFRLTDGGWQRVEGFPKGCCATNLVSAGGAVFWWQAPGSGGDAGLRFGAWVQPRDPDPTTTTAAPFDLGSHRIMKAVLESMSKSGVTGEAVAEQVGPARWRITIRVVGVTQKEELSVIVTRTGENWGTFGPTVCSFFANPDGSGSCVGEMDVAPDGVPLAASVMGDAAGEFSDVP